MSNSFAAALRTSNSMQGRHTVSIIEIDLGGQQRLSDLHHEERRLLEECHTQDEIAGYLAVMPLPELIALVKVALIFGAKPPDGVVLQVSDGGIGFIHRLLTVVHSHYSSLNKPLFALGWTLGENRDKINIEKFGQRPDLNNTVADLDDFLEMISTDGSLIGGSDEIVVVTE